MNILAVLDGKVDRVQKAVSRRGLSAVAAVACSTYGGEQLRYENCNRFYLKDRLFQGVFVYMSGDNLLKEGDL